MTVYLFFFSSRRRHTRWPRDWSSDVCSSDLVGLTLNLASQPGETGGFSAADHVRVFQQYAPEQRIDTVIADPSAVEDLDDLNDTAKGVGARVLYRQRSEERRGGKEGWPEEAQCAE